MVEGVGAEEQPVLCKAVHGDKLTIQFCLETVREMACLPVELVVRKEEWAKEMRMSSLLSMSRGSIELGKMLGMI